MKSVLFILIIITMSFSGCVLNTVDNDVDAEIKELVRDIPKPIRYDPDSGDIMEPEDIVVTSEWSGGNSYSPKSGEPTSTYRVVLVYDRGFWGNGYQATLTMLVPNENVLSGSREQRYFTLAEIKDNINKLYWD